MIRYESLGPPKHIYPVDEWKIIEKSFYPRFLGQTETIFSVGNGYLGMRGNFDEGSPAFLNSTFVNGFYESWPIVYGEEAYGFAKTGQTIVNVTDSKIIKLYVDDEPFYLPTANLLSFERVLNMKAGTLDREVLWETPAGKKVLIQSRRLVSFEHRHLAAISYQVTVLNAEAPVAISSELISHPPKGVDDKDPRSGKRLSDRVLIPKESDVNDHRIVLGLSTHRSKMTLACGIEHQMETDCPFSQESECWEDGGQVVFTIEAQPAVPIRLTKYISYHTSRRTPSFELCARVKRTLNRASGRGFDRLLADQREYVDDFWRRSDVQIEGGPGPAGRAQKEIQQALRWNLFQLLQATGRAEGAGVPAKGLTGPGYEGQYFWDTEIYVLPFLIYTKPRIAKNLLKFRHSMLEKARQRARELNHKGAMFPWRTINGEEASAYYAAGTAQYHINADIMYTLKKYVDVTGDTELLYSIGAEMLVETARLWIDLGFFSERAGGKFCIHGVTGPDEYNTVVNNNTFTNLMARENLWYAAQAVESLREEKPKLYEILVDKTGLKTSEIGVWKAAADNMYVPFDEETGIHPQDDSFLDKEVWNFESTPADKYPLLLHYHPLVIYRHRVIKQADVVLAMFLLGNEFSIEEKKRNFDYYDPLTTGDSSLSACIQSIVAAECGYMDQAVEYARYAVLMDLANAGGNVQDGCHIASMGGTWMILVYGFGGMRDYDGRISFQPRLPEQMKRLRFSLAIRDQTLEVDIEKKSVTYLLKEGLDLTIGHYGKEIHLAVGEPVSMKIGSK